VVADRATDGQLSSNTTDEYEASNLSTPRGSYSTIPNSLSFSWIEGSVIVAQTFCSRRRDQHSSSVPNVGDIAHSFLVLHRQKDHTGRCSRIYRVQHLDLVVDLRPLSLSSDLDEGLFEALFGSFPGVVLEGLQQALVVGAAGTSCIRLAQYSAMSLLPWPS
jgi:hypothetical protein